MNKARKFVYKTLGFNLLLLAAFISTSITVWYVQTNQRTEDSLHSKVAALETSSNATSRIMREEFWRSSDHFPENNIVVIDTRTNISTFPSKWTGEEFEKPTKGLGDDPIWWTERNKIGNLVFVVGRGYDIAGDAETVRYEIFSKTLVWESFKGAWPLFMFYALCFAWAIRCLIGALSLTVRAEGEIEGEVLAATKSQRVLNAAIDQLDDGVAVVDEDMAIVHASVKFADVMGYVPEELIDKSINIFVHPDRADWHGEKFRGFKFGDGAIDYRVVKPYTKSGEQVTVTLGIKKIEGKIRGVQYYSATIRLQK